VSLSHEDFARRTWPQEQKLRYMADWE